MNRTSCVMNIKSKMKTLTGSEKKVANYILNNYMYILDYTVTELQKKPESAMRQLFVFAGVLDIKDTKI